MTNNSRSAPVINPGSPLASGPGETMTFVGFLMAWMLSAVVHVGIIGLFFIVILTGGYGRADTQDLQQVVVTTTVEQTPQELILDNPDIGLDPEIPLNYDVPRIDKFSVPGQVNPGDIGITDAPPAPPANLPPPIGTGFGQGGGVDGLTFGKAPSFGSTGGAGGKIFMPGGFGGRSGATRQQMALQGGGSKESEAAVARALEWLAKHQSPNGNWALDGFHNNPFGELGPNAKRLPGNCDCNGQGQKNDTAATAFGLLPFLAAGQTHRPSGDRGGLRDYSKNVENGLKYLISKQGKDGSFGGGMYAHGLAAIAMCEAFGMTSDPLLRESAKRGLDYIINAQHEASGGWRYAPKQSGDTSVVGWQVMALKSGQMAGLNVPTPTLKGAEKWLDSCMDPNNYGYGYTGRGSGPATTAVGLLSRQYLGWSPRKHELLQGVELMRKTPPGKINNMYYYYYATQVMHHVGGEVWEEWNNGVKGQKGMRDWLIEKQCKEGTGHRYGSWDPQGDQWSSHGGGRIMMTSLCVLTLEVYYRHLPLYRRDLGGNKELEP